MKIIEETPYRFRIEREGAMRMPGMVFASRSLLPEDQGDMALTQVANVATLPGIVRASYAMPDVRWGYGFPIGGVAATDVDNDGVISPGGVGFDISCGVRLLVSRELDRDGLQPWIRAIPRGVGAKGGVAAAEPLRVAAGAERWCPVRCAAVCAYTAKARPAHCRRIIQTYRPKSSKAERKCDGPGAGACLRDRRGNQAHSLAGCTATCFSAASETPTETVRMPLS